MSRANSTREFSDLELEQTSRARQEAGMRRWRVFHRKDDMASGHTHYHGPKRRVFTIGVGGPVGSGKTAQIGRAHV